MVLTTGSCAILAREPCQAGNRAAISGYRYVPRGCLARANCMISVYGITSISGCTAYKILFKEFYNAKREMQNAKCRIIVENQLR